MAEVKITDATSATWKDAGNRAAVMRAWQQAKKDGKQVPITTWVNGKPRPTIVGTDGRTYNAPSYATVLKWDEYKKEVGTEALQEAPAGGGLDVASILEESKTKLNAGKQALEKRRAELDQQIKGIDAEVIKINEALKKLE